MYANTLMNILVDKESLAVERLVLRPKHITPLSRSSTSRRRGIRNAMHHALNVSEILRSIFVQLKRDSNARNARVCKQWSDVALDITWAVVAPEVFRALAPMIVSADDDDDDFEVLVSDRYLPTAPFCIAGQANIIYQTFTRSITTKDWQRFMRNSHRVREWVEHAGGTRYILSDSALKAISASRTALVVFPKMREMLITSATFEPLFMSPSTTSLQLILLPISGDRNPTVLENIASRMPQIQQLDILYVSKTAPYDDELLELLQSLTMLTQVRLPFQYFDASVARTLSGAQHLQYVYLDSELPIITYPSGATPRPLTRPDRPLIENPFPSLHYFSLSTPNLHDIITFASQPAQPLRNLESLWIHSPQISPAQAVRNFLEALVLASPVLGRLELHLHDFVYKNGNALRQVQPLTAEDILPILHFEKLFVFRIAHPYPIQLNDGDVHEIATRWPHMQKLHLNPNPVIPMETTLTLSAIIPLLLNCPNIYSISLFLDATQTTPTALEPVSGFTPHSQLELQLGSSPPSHRGQRL